MKRVRKRRKHNIFIYAERQQKNIEYIQLHEYYQMCCCHRQTKREEVCIRSHVDDVLAGDSRSRVLKLLPVRRPVSGADVEASVDVVLHCIQYNETAKPRDDEE